MIKTKRLNLKRETVRQLARLDLEHIAGGGNRVVALDTELVTCPWTHLAATTAC